MNRKKNLAFLKHPIFICGHRRSGTTLFLSLLDNNTKYLCYPTETGFFYAVYPICFKDKNEKNLLKQIKNFPLKNLSEHIKINYNLQSRPILPFKMQKLARLIEKKYKQSKTKSPAMVLKVFMHCFWKTYKFPKHPKGWIEKTTSSEIYALEMLKWFPNAKFIHIIRDPRDNWASIKSGWHTRFKYFNENISRLIQSCIERGRLGLDLALYNLSIIGKKQYLIVRYEDLVAQPKTTMKKVAKFLKIKFNLNLLSPTCLGHPWYGNNYQGTKFREIAKRKKNNWKKSVTSNETALIEFYFLDLMKKFNYRSITTETERAMAALKHYKWYNYAQKYSFKLH